MYSRSLPMPGDEKEDDAPLYDESKDANDLNNFSDFTEDEEIVKA